MDLKCFCVQLIIEAQQEYIGKDGHKLDEHLKIIAQQKYMLYYNKSKEEFIQRYGKNYIQEEKMEKENAKSIKIDLGAYNLLKKLKERDGVPMFENLKRAVKEYAKNKGLD